MVTEVSAHRHPVDPGVYERVSVQVASRSNDCCRRDEEAERCHQSPVIDELTT